MTAWAYWLLCFSKTQTLMRGRIVLFIWIFLVSSYCFGQKVAIQLHTTTDGLSSNHLRLGAVVQDAQGFLWVPAAKYNRFDGYQFLNYTKDSNPVFDVHEPSSTLLGKGDYLIFLKDRQLIEFNTRNGKSKRYALDSLANLAHLFLPYATEIFTTSNNGIVIPTIDTLKRAVVLIVFRDGHLKKGPPLYDVAKGADLSFIPSIFGDREGNIFYSTDTLKHVIKIDSSGNKIRTFQTPKEHNYYNFSLSENGTIYLKGYDHILVLEEGAKQAKRHPISEVLEQIDYFNMRDMLVHSNGDFWMIGDNRQLLFYEAKSQRTYNLHEQIKKEIPNDFSLHNIFIDHTGVVWITTPLGLLQVTPKKNLFDTYFMEPLEQCRGLCSFRGFAEDHQGTVYASFYMNIFKIYPDHSSSIASLLPVAHTPYDLFLGGEQLILNNGLVFNLANKQISNPYEINQEAYDHGVFTQDDQGNIWWAFINKFYHLDLNASAPKWRIIDQEIKEINLIRDIRYDAVRKKVWIANQTLANYDPASGVIEILEEQDLNLNSIIYNVYPDKKGWLWLATEDGLSAFHPEARSSKHYTINDGLSNRKVVTILPEGDSCLWLGTNSGLSRFDKTSETFINFYEEDGLANNEFNRRSAYQSKEGRFFFGGVSGITAFYPDSVMTAYWKNAKAGKLSLISFSKTDVEKDTTIKNHFNEAHPSVKIFHTNRFFQFEFALTNYDNIEQVKYSYQLEGYDQSWSVPSSRNIASFNSLPSGQYTLRVKALNNRGQWHRDELKVNITVYPPWWKSHWAYASYAIALLTIAVGIFYFLKKRMELKNSLMQKQLEAERLQELDSFKTRLFTNLTHEFRTPLTVILGMARQLIEAPKKDVLLHSTIIERNGKNLLQLVNQLLDLAKLEDQSFQLHLQNSDIIPFLRYLTESFQSYANGQNLRLGFFSTQKALSMDYDPEQITQVMTNLIANALKFTPSGGAIKVEVDAQNDLLTIKVADTGIGIPKENLDHIFDRFYQVDGSTTRTNEGTGIGLAHNYELVKLMDGQIRVESELGKGSTFIVQLKIKQNTKEVAVEMLLPQKVEEINIPSSIHSLNSLDSGGASVEQKESNLSQILIIEDNADVIHYLQTCMKGQYQVNIALNGRIGIEKALETIPDIIISDVMMPEKDGFEVCNALKNDERTSHIPILLLTAKADIDSKIEGLSRGADAYLAKPFDRQELMVRLAQMVAKKEKLIAYFSKKYSNALVSLPSLEQIKAENEPIQVENVFVQKVRKIVAAHYADEDFSLPQLCQKIGMSRSQLFRKMKALMAISPSEFIRNYRMQEAKKLLESGEWNVSEVAWKVGFKHLPHFSKTFQETFGYPPSATHK